MKLRPLPLGFSIGILFALGILFISYYPILTGMIFDGETHGESIRYVLQDMYPWYSHATFLRVLLGMLYAFVDGFIFGLLLAAFYNLFCCKTEKCCECCEPAKPAAKPAVKPDVKPAVKPARRIAKKPTAKKTVKKTTRTRK